MSLILLCTFSLIGLVFFSSFLILLHVHYLSQDFTLQKKRFSLMISLVSELIITPHHIPPPPHFTSLTCLWPYSCIAVTSSVIWPRCRVGQAWHCCVLVTAQISAHTDSCLCHLLRPPADSLSSAADTITLTPAFSGLFCTPRGLSVYD